MFANFDVTVRACRPASLRPNDGVSRCPIEKRKPLQRNDLTPGSAGRKATVGLVRANPYTFGTDHSRFAVFRRHRCTPGRLRCMRSSGGWRRSVAGRVRKAGRSDVCDRGAEHAEQQRGVHPSEAARDRVVARDVQPVGAVVDPGSRGSAVDRGDARARPDRDVRDLSDRAGDGQQNGRARKRTMRGADDTGGLRGWVKPSS